MLDRRDVEALMKTFTYKPNWGFEVIGEADRVGIKVTMWTLDARQIYPPMSDLTAYCHAEHGLLNTTVVVPQRYRFSEEPKSDLAISLMPSKGARLVMIPPYVLDYASPQDPKHFWEWVIHDLIKGFEHHEIDEWAQVNGECVTDPHPKG